MDCISLIALTDFPALQSTRSSGDVPRTKARGAFFSGVRRDQRPPMHVKHYGQMETNCFSDSHYDSIPEHHVTASQQNVGLLRSELMVCCKYYVRAFLFTSCNHLCLLALTGCMTLVVSKSTDENLTRGKAGRRNAATEEEINL
jgi:hypothetical protein